MKQLFRIFLLFIFLLGMTTPALASSIELSQGWTYRWGDSPLREDGTPLWLLDSSSSGWRPAGNSLRFKRPPNGTVLWLRTTIPPIDQPNPCITFEGSHGLAALAESMEVYLDDFFLYRAEKLRSQKGPRFVGSILLPLDPNYRGKHLTLRLDAGNHPYLGIVGKIRLASYRESLRAVVQRDLDTFILGFFFLILSGILFTFTVFSRLQERGALFTLAAFTLCTGTWSVISNNNANLFFPDPPLLWEVLATLATLLTPVTMAAFFEQIFGSGKFCLHRRTWQAFLGFAGLTLFVHVLNAGTSGSFMGLYMLLWGVFNALTVVAVLFFYGTAIAYACQGDHEARVFTVGFSAFAFFVIKYALQYFIHHQTSPGLITWGAFFFILSLILLLGKRFDDTQNRLEDQNRMLNRMWQEVKDSRDAVAEWNQTLEQRVEERTHQLEDANEELKKAFDTLQQTQTQLIQSEKMVALGNLVAGIAHEINTPVGIGVTAASHLEEKTKELQALFLDNKMKKSDLERYVEVATETSDMILTNLRRASDLIRSFKQVAVDQSCENHRRFRVHSYLEEILLSLRPQLKKTPHQVIIECDPSLEIESHPGAFSQIITNLVMNSLTHAFDAGRAGIIEIRAEEAGDSLLVTYADNGKGITPENQKHIFEPFFTTLRGRGGTGLGLHIVYNLVHKTFDGSIACESEPGRTVFTIEFPIHCTHPA